MLFGCPRQNINHSPENLKVIYIMPFVFYARINYQFKTSELKIVEKSWWSKQFKFLSPVSLDWECTFMYEFVTYSPGR